MQCTAIVSKEIIILATPKVAYQSDGCLGKVFSWYIFKNHCFVIMIY